MEENFENLNLKYQAFVMKSINPDEYLKVFSYYFRNKDRFEIAFPDLNKDFYTPEFFLKALYKEFKMELLRKHFRLYIFDENDTKFEHILGDISLGNFLNYPLCSCTIGYKTDKFADRKGVLKKCIPRAVDFAFNEFKLHKISAFVLPENEASAGLMDALGWTFEGMDLQYARIRGVWRDHYKYSFFNEDY